MHALRPHTRLDWRTILSAVIMLAGILLLVIAQHEAEPTMLSAGLFVTACGVGMGTVFVIASR